jgi:hypothetical protein
MMKTIRMVLSGCAVTVLLIGLSIAQPKITGWPGKIPARIQDGNNKDLFMMTLGEVESRLADGVFDAANDELSLKNGSVKKNYYRDALKVKYYKPLDKSTFPLPPSGWCSWYYYYQEINEKEVEQNAQWIARNLRDYGAQVVQIDDGWQGTGHGMGENRDWTTIDNRFPSGMDHLASLIKSLGLTPGIWLAPHGQSNDRVVRDHPNVFLQKADGTSASDTWEGKWLVDPSTPESQKFVKDLFATLSRWGYEYFKIDGQPIVVDEYRKNKSRMKFPADDTDVLYRRTLEGIRSVIGPARYLLGCWGIPLEGAGIMNGSRTGGDIVLGWDGFKVAMAATMQQYFLHNIVWYCDPDVMLIRSPLTLEQARAWSTLQGLTGQALMSSDRLMDLSDERVELLRRVYPAVDIRPMDLFPSEREKHIWDLKVHHLGRDYDVVGLFNFSETKSRPISLNWNDLGLPQSGPVHVFDFWNKEYLGAWEQGMAVSVPPTSCRVLTLLPSNGQIQLISTSRHISQGWVDLLSLKHDEGRSSYSGKSRIIGNDPYELRFAFPRGKNFSITKAVAHSPSGRVPVKVTNHQGWAVAELTSPKTTTVDWEVHFEPAVLYHAPPHGPGNLSVERVGLDGVNVVWQAQYYLTAGYQVSLNGTLLGYTPTPSFPIRGLDPILEYTAELRSVGVDGSVSENKGEVKFSLKSMIPSMMSLTEIEPLKATSGWRIVEINRAVSEKSLSLGGTYYGVGIGTHANSEIEYDLRGLYDSLSVLAGIDDGNSNDTTRVEFSIAGDGKELWRSGIMKKTDGPKRVGLNVSGVNRLLLRVYDGGDGIDYDHADWVEPTLIRRTEKR